ncbi:MAG: 2-C-methyl-D-erythritol 2,4-cyclodiphosphate synthase [Clostridia bacterium]|nr:2-C-methyl-D-erythritol 2,4-cyclodiphosphate synthase [Clostridia bacterium]
MEYCFSTIGQDSHRFTESVTNDAGIVLGGITIPSQRNIEANSDGDVLLHAVTNAISGATGVNILGKRADELCIKEGIKDSKVYLNEALKYLNKTRLIHISISVECLYPKLSPYIEDIKTNIAELLDISVSQVGLTATTGEGLTEFGKGNGIQVFVCASFIRTIE